MRLIAATLGLAIAASNLEGQKHVAIPDLGPGAAGRILRDALGRPHRLVEPDTGPFILTRGEQQRTTVIVLGRNALVSGKVEGDVIVVAGDLFVRPGADIDGRAIAVGGGAYPSALARVAQGALSFRDLTFAIHSTADGYRLEYQSLREHASPPLLFPGVYGLRFPSYDRVNGASLPFGPAFTFAGGRAELNALATYRSDLGKIDPSVAVSMQLTRRTRAALRAERGTFSNDLWIYSNFVNSLTVLASGRDARNYYRADRAELTAYRVWEGIRTQIEPYVGGRIERAWSVGPAFGEQRGPWSWFGRTDSLGMWRPNPPIDSGTIASALAGVGLQWESQDLDLRLRSLGEVALSSPNDERFQQLTSDLEVRFPTFGEQEYGLDVHWLTTFGDTPPVQRFGYLGGSGTLPFVEMLEQGGDEVLLIDQRYSIPLLNIRLGIMGIPTLQFRHRMGSAGIGTLPSFEQVIGVGLMLTVIRGEIQLDPATSRVRGSIGFTFSR